MGNRADHIFIDEQGKRLPVDFYNHWDFESIIGDICRIIVQREKSQFSWEMQTYFIRDVDGLVLYANGTGVEAIYNFQTGMVQTSWEPEDGITSPEYDALANGCTFARAVEIVDGWNAAYESGKTKSAKSPFRFAFWKTQYYHAAQRLQRKESKK